MPRRRLHIPPPAPAELRADFERIRQQFGVEVGFPEEVERAAAQVAQRPPGDGRSDLGEVEFFTVDPPGSLDLDQAMQLERRDGGYRVRYAIADVGHFVDRGGPIEAEAWRRGQTVYCPDVRAPLYPLLLSEGAASLLPDQDRPAIVFTIDLDGSGAPSTPAHVERALVRSRRKLDYAGLAAEGAGLLEEIGRLREDTERARGGVRLDSPRQAVVADADGEFVLRWDRRIPVEDWNAQISLLAGSAAASIMLEAGVGLLRTMGGIDDYRLAVLRRTAAALDVPWPDGLEYPGFIRSLDPAQPRQAALLEEAHSVMGHAGYAAFDGEPPAQPVHAALAMPYAHTTAPMRRLADRYVLDLLCELCGGLRPSEEERDTLGRLPDAMSETSARIAQLDRAVVDDVEARLLEPRAGERFPASVVELDSRGARIQILDPPVRARLHVEPPPPLGARIEVELVRADPASRSLQFALVPDESRPRA
jgi:exoribonuclease R